MGEVIYYIVPVPVGFIIFLCVLCARFGARRTDSRNSHNISTRRNGRRVVRRVIIIPRQFESARTPIITGEHGYPEQAAYPPQPYDPQATYPSQPYDPPPSYETAAAYGEPQSDTGAYVRAMEGWQQQMQAPALVDQAPEYTGQQPMVNQSNAAAASNGLLLDVTSLPCASGPGGGTGAPAQPKISNM